LGLDGLYEKNILPVVKLVLLQVREHEDNELAQQIRPFQGFSALDGLPQATAFNLVQVPDLIEGLEGFERVEVDDASVSRKRVPAERTGQSRLQ